MTSRTKKQKTLREEISKGKRKASSSSSGLIDEVFSTGAQYELYSQKNIQRTISESRYVHFEFFEQQFENDPKFDFIVKLKNYGLSKLLKIKNKYDSKVIRAFYTNLHWDTTRLCVASEVKGQPIQITPDQLAEWLNIEREGYQFDDTPGSLSKINNYNSQIILNSLIPDPPTHISNYTNYPTKNFDLSNRMLHYIISACLTNKSGNHAFASLSEQFIMYCINSSEAVDIPFFILETMLRTAKTRVPSLKYGSLISWILTKNGIDPLLNKDNAITPKPIDVEVVQNLRYELHGRIWVQKEMTAAQKKAEERRLRAETVRMAREEAEEEGVSGQSSQAAPQDFSAILKAIQELQVSQDKRFDALDDKVEALMATTADHSKILEQLKRLLPTEPELAIIPYLP